MMKLLSMICVIAITWAPMVLACRSNKESSSSDSLRSCENINKVKLTNVTVLKVHRKYSVNQLRQAEVVKVNETYNRLVIDYDIKKGFPMNTVFSVKVLRLNPTSQRRYKKIHEYSIRFCEDFNNEYFTYLPDKLIDLVKQGKCIPEGIDYKSEDTGYFKFYDLLSAEELLDSRFKLITSLESGRETLYSFQLDFESNCKKDENLSIQTYEDIA